MQLTIRGKGTKINLTKREFLASGGEGQIFAKGSLVYKVCDPGKMIPDGKFHELAVLDHPHIIRPIDVLLDSKNNPTGYTMRYLDNTICLCQLFTKAFRNRAGVTPATILDLVRQMQQTISFVHSKQVLIVDLNELNFLVDNPLFKDVYFIDVNSYQTPHYPATAIMESIRDRHCKGNHFTTNTDWFSFAIVSFQMFIGIHPYKGKHPSYPDPRSALDARMLANLSVLNPQVSYPKGACQPMSAIPDIYQQWYKAVFEDGKRLPPPLDLFAKVVIVTPTVKKLAGSNYFDIVEVNDFAEDILRVFYVPNKEIVVGMKHIYIDRHPVTNFLPQQEMQVCMTPRNAHPVAASVEKGVVRLTDLVTRKDLPLTLGAEKLMVYDGRCYAIGGGKVLEVKFTELPGNTLCSAEQVGNVSEQGTRVFDGVIIQNLFDAHYVSVFPSSGEMRQFAMRELDNYKVVDAKYERGLLQIVAVERKTGKYDRFVFWFASDWSKHDYLVVKDIVFTGLNFTVLDNGVCVQINEEEKVEIFRVSDPRNKKEIDDPVIEADMHLTSRGAQVQFTRNQKLYSMTMRVK